MGSQKKRNWQQIAEELVIASMSYKDFEQRMGVPSGDFDPLVAFIYNLKDVAKPSALPGNYGPEQYRSVRVMIAGKLYDWWMREQASLSSANEKPEDLLRAFATCQRLLFMKFTRDLDQTYVIEEQERSFSSANFPQGMVRAYTNCEKRMRERQQQQQQQQQQL